MENERPIRIAQVIGKLWNGGVENVVFNYYRQINKNNIQFDFFYDADSTIEPPRDLIDMGARFYKIPPYQNLLRYLKTLLVYFRENHYQIVHSHINTLSVFPLFVAWIEKVPVRIAHNHSVPGGHELRRNILKYILRTFAKVFSTDYFACSEKAGRWMFGDRAYDSGKVVVMKNALDFDRFKPNLNRSLMFKVKYGLENKFVVEHVGRFTYAKNHRFLLEIFKEILKQKENAVLLLIGDGELHNEILQEVAELNIKDNVILVGQVVHPEYYYSLANVLVVPSIFEGLSLTTLESQIAGVPVVISDAIPDEAVISNACVHVHLDESPIKWADVAIRLAMVPVKLIEKSKDYSIVKCAKTLEAWYFNHLKKVHEVVSCQ